MRYKLNFKGFFDTPEMLFGRSVIEALTSIDFNSIENIVDDCINNIKYQLGITLNKNSIEAIQLMNADQYAAQLLVVGQDRYMLLINPNKIDSEDALISAVYHELCHVYQLNKLFTDKIIAYNYFENNIEATDETKDLTIKHLNVNGGHTEYWQELAEKLNNTLNPAKKIAAFLKENINAITFEVLEEDYFKLDFDGFYDTPEMLFGKKENSTDD
jgi:hypothetical protein